MKKIISLALAAGMLVGATAQAQAADISVYGLFRVQGEVNGTTEELTSNTGFVVKERVELGMRVKASDEVMANLRLRVPSAATWAGDEQDVAVRLREAWIQFPVASLTARVGYQMPSLPSIASGANPYSRGWNTLPGVALVGNFGSVMPSFSWWASGDADATKNESGKNTTSNKDAYVLQLPVAIADGMKLTPWVAATVTDTITTTAFGASFDANVDAISAGAGVIGAMTSVEDQDMSFIVAANAAMDLGALTPGLAVWYGIKGSALTSQYNSGHWGGFNGANDNLNNNTSWMQAGLTLPTGLTPFDTLGVQANVADIALGETAKLGAHVLYVMGMDDSNDGNSALTAGGKFTTEVAKGLTGMVEANYIMPMGDVSTQDDGFSVAFGVNMAF